MGRTLRTQSPQTPQNLKCKIGFWKPKKKERAAWEKKNKNQKDARTPNTLGHSASESHERAGGSGTRSFLRGPAFRSVGVDVGQRRRRFNGSNKLQLVGRMEAGWGRTRILILVWIRISWVVVIRVGRRWRWRRPASGSSSSRGTVVVIVVVRVRTIIRASFWIIRHSTVWNHRIVNGRRVCVGRFDASRVDQ